MERLVSAWGCARELLPAWAAFQRGTMERDGCRVWSQLLFGCVVMGSGHLPVPSVPLPARQCLDVSTDRGKAPPAPQTSLAAWACPPLLEAALPALPCRGDTRSGPRAVPPHRMSPEPLPWPAPPPGLFPRPENNTSPSIQETFIT